MLIRKLEEMDFDKGDVVELDGTIISVVNEGDESRKLPIRFMLKIEGSGELIQSVTWKFDNLEMIKQAVDTIDIMRFQGIPGKFGETPQLKVGNIFETNKTSKKKKLRVRPSNEKVKAEITTLIRGVKNRDFKKILNELILKNKDFFVWPAASKVHHAYQGGLASHSLSVANNVNLLYKNYGDENIDLDLLITGALLHDIGKMIEYNQDGTRNTLGALVGHLVLGYDMVGDVSHSLGIDPFENRNILMLRHIILSHHEKLEFGSPVTPIITEALLISQADNMDAKMETAFENIENSIIDEIVYANTLEGSRIMKWQEKK